MKCHLVTVNHSLTQKVRLAVAQETIPLCRYRQLCDAFISLSFGFKIELEPAASLFVPNTSVRHKAPLRETELREGKSHFRGKVKIESIAEETKKLNPVFAFLCLSCLLFRGLRPRGRDGSFVEQGLNASNRLQHEEELREDLEEELGREPFTPAVPPGARGWVDFDAVDVGVEVKVSPVVLIAVVLVGQ